jgi:hypothetical protein
VEGEGRGREPVTKSSRGVSMSKAHFMHVWKCHNETTYFEQLI